VTGITVFPAVRRRAPSQHRGEPAGAAALEHPARFSPIAGVRFVALRPREAVVSSMQAYASRTGWIMVAAIVMFSVGALRLISGISYLVDSHNVNDLTVGLFGDNMWLWGIWDLGIAALAFWAFYSLLGGGEFGRVIAYLWAIL